MLQNPARKNIVSLLRKQSGLAYSDFLEEDMDSSRLAYHLNCLKNKNIVMKQGEKYYLTEFGKQEVAFLDGDTQEQEKQPLQVAVNVVIKNEKLLLAKRKREPFRGRQTHISGKIKFGETVKQTASRELLEETGLTADLTLKGIAHLISRENGKTTYHHNMYLFKAENLKGELITENEEATNEWIPLNKLSETNCFSTIPLFAKITQNPHFTITEIQRTLNEKTGKFDLKTISETKLKH